MAILCFPCFGSIALIGVAIHAHFSETSFFFSPWDLLPIHCSGGWVASQRPRRREERGKKGLLVVLVCHDLFDLAGKMWHLREQRMNAVLEVQRRV